MAHAVIYKIQDLPSDLTSPTVFDWNIKSSNGFPMYFLDGGEEVIEVSPEELVTSNEGEEIESNNENGVQEMKTYSENKLIPHEVEEVEPNNQTERNAENEGNGLTEAEELSNYMEMVTAYKCRMCAYNTLEIPQLVNHFNSEHNDLNKKSIVVYCAPEMDISGSCDVDSPPSQTAGERMMENVNSMKAGPLPPQPSPPPPPPPSSPPPPPPPPLQPSLPPQPSPPLQQQLPSPPSSQSPLLNMMIFLCGQCSRTFATTEDCREHMINDHSLIFNENVERPNIPNVDSCESEAKQEADAEHKFSLQQNVERHIRCDFRSCQFKFSSVEMMEQHLLCHISNCRREFKCLVCDKMYDRWRTCSMHLWRAHSIDIDLLTCKMCNVYKTVTRVKLETHMKIHNEERLYTCSDCGKKFKQSSQLRNHRVSHMNKKDSGTPRWYAAKSCNICHKEYADSKCLKKHVQAVHSKLRPYVCQVCGHSSARKAMLTMHFRQHTGEKPYACASCDYRTGDHNSLRRHTMRHTGERPYRCPYCLYSAIQSNSYKNHIRNKHPGLEGIYSCTDCSFRSVSEDAFLMHVSDHRYGVIDAVKLTQNQLDVFPENVAAAKLIYSCLNAGTREGNSVEANLTSSATSADGTSQTITIQIPGPEEECFLATIVTDEECMEEMDTGGITIPAEQSC